jgi:DMSO/TMAO reductase YedYZ molybdopterin-dependent catalytic subunit
LIKWIEKIELTGDSSYRGYWEQRGYSNDGDLNRSFF